MTNLYPWRPNTTPPIAAEDDSRYETPGGAQNKADIAEETAKEYTDNFVNTSTNIADRAVTKPKIAYGAVGGNQLDPALLQNYGDIAVQGKFQQVDEQLADTTILINPLMSRSEIQSLLDLTGEFKFLGGQYNLDYVVIEGYPVCLQIKSNTKIRFDKDATIKISPVDSDHYYILNIEGRDNVTIEGAIVVGERNEHIGTTGEFGIGVRVYNSTNVNLYNINASDCWGDGFYISGGSTNVVVDNVISDNNRRQGLTLGNVENIFISNSTFQNTHGTAPEAGIDIEPNLGTDRIKNVHISKCSFKSNAGSGLEINILNLVGKIGPPGEVSIYVDQCTFDGNLRNFTYVCSNSLEQINNVVGLIRVTNSKAKSSKYGWALYNIKDGTMPKLEVDGFEIGAWTDYAIHTTTDVLNDGSGPSNYVQYGGFDLRNISLVNPPATIPGSPKGAILFNPGTYKQINAKIEGLSAPSDMAFPKIYWSRGYGHVGVKLPVISSLSAVDATVYATVNEIITLSIDTTFQLPKASLHKDREFTFIHQGQANAFRIGVVDAGDGITGIPELVSGLANILSINGTQLTFKSDGVLSWVCTNRVGKIGPLGYHFDRRYVYGSAMPTTGTWAQGDFVQKTNATSGGIFGWRRITTGSNNVLGTDWEIVGAGYLSSVATAPLYVGQIAVVSGVSYIAVGVSSSLDWKQISN